MKVSPNGHYLTTDDGTPFFYLADTAWRLLYQTIEDAEHYLRNRRDKGFSVVQPCLLFELYRTDGTFLENAAGQAPFLTDTLTDPNPAFFEHADAIIDKAAELGMTVALLPTWGAYVIPTKWGPSRVTFDTETAQRYGVFLGKRYRDKPVIWVIGGDRNPQNDEQVEIWRAMVAGIKAEDGGAHLMTYHPTTRPHLSSSFWFHNEDWLDFNMMQTSTRNWDTYNHILHDYNLTPPKPAVDGETRYEHSHQNFQKKIGPRMTPRHVRQSAYNAMLSGALGHTYGCRDVWSFHVPDQEEPKRDVDTHWKEAMDFPGAFHMGHLKTLFTDYPWHKLVPDQQHGLVPAQTIRYAWAPDYGLLSLGKQESETYVPAARAQDGSFALAYTPIRQTLSIDMTRIKGKRVKASWFDPREGTYAPIDVYPAEGEVDLTPPDNGDDSDATLVLESTE